MSAKRTKTPSKRRPATDAPAADAKPTRGRADLARLRDATEARIARTSPRELRDLPDDFWDDAELVVPERKVPISLRVDADVLAHFKSMGPRYQTRMNAVLRAYVRRMLRERGQD